MPVTKLLRAHPFRFFFAVLFIGIATSVLLARSLSLKPGYTPIPDDLPTERQKIVLNEEQDMSKWLLGLASGALTAAFAARLSDKTLTDSPLLMFSFASLVTSMFGAFLSHETHLSILRVGPMDYVYSSLFIVPTLIQSWSFAAGITALGWAMFRPRVAATAAILSLLTLVPAGQAKAQELDRKACVKAWYADRFQDQGADASIAIAFLAALERKAHAANENANAGISSCDDVNRVLDSIRTVYVTNVGHKDTSQDVTAYMASLQGEVAGPGLTVGDSVAYILRVLNPLGVPFGVLAVRIPPPPAPEPARYTIYIDGLVVGYVPWTGRITTTPHQITVLSDSSLKPVYKVTGYQLANGESKTIVLPVKP